MNYIALIAGTLFIIIFSWFLSIKHKRYHGVPRFFAFQSIFMLFLLNFNVWFFNPFSINQIFSWLFLILSALVAVYSFQLLKDQGKPEINFENTTLLVTSGLYGYIRHPMYLSLLLLGTGIMLKKPCIMQIVLGTINLATLYLTARIEEKEMIKKFGKAFENYIKETKMFIPFII